LILSPEFEPKELLDLQLSTTFLRLLLSAILGIVFLASAVHAAPLRVAYSAISGAMSSLWVAQEGGYFKREGLDTELLYIGGGSLLIQSMLSGEVPFAYGP
jgi:ABC-type nitrate/sulfonate/bicarbonate transport system substrate-binding protein